MRHKDKWMPIVLMVFTAAFVMGIFFWMKTWNSTRILPVTDVAGEKTDPTIGRLITGVVFFVCSLVSVNLAVHFHRKSPDQLAVPWMWATLGGTLLWTSIGECSWHFGFRVMSDDGEILFTNFPRIESIQGIPLIIVILLVLAMAWKSMPFPLMSYALTFAGNWYGHLSMIGLYPIAMACGMEAELPVFYRVSGLIHTFIFAAAGLFLILKKGTKRENRYYSAVLLYAALGTLMFGVMMGET
ncbi:MAG: hypothetical protein ABTB30_17115 [Clostridia bacterium]